MLLNTKLVFFGGNQLSVTVLKNLVEAGFKPSLVITSPDEPIGKKKTLTSPPLKIAAQNLKSRRKVGTPIAEGASGLTTLQPKSLKDGEVKEKIKSIKPDIGIVAAYGKIIPKEILDIFPKGVLNLHPSLLPKYRGPSPIQTAILNNDFDTGVSIILLDEQMDHGQILAQEKIKLTGQEYFSELYEKLTELGGKLLVKTIPLWLEKKISPKEQDHAKASICGKLNWSDGKIKAQDTAEKAYAKIRALGVEPGCYLELRMGNNELRILKIIKARPLLNSQFIIHNSGTGLREENKELVLKCRNGALLLELVQPEGKKIMSGKEFLNGYRNKII
ncbi:TPA: methionyl-tRNA formyltransferase [Patescibacteria group bacterium]|nr:methionyl-tRNA formyltransferase [Patescibacteria group bacterium]